MRSPVRSAMGVIVGTREGCPYGVACTVIACTTMGVIVGTRMEGRPLRSPVGSRSPVRSAMGGIVGTREGYPYGVDV